MENNEKAKLVDQYVEENNISAAVKLLFDLIVDAVEKNHFSEAEALREKLLEVDAMALNEIVKSGELIEAKKTDAIDKKHLKRWSSLYGLFTAEEQNAFYFATEELNKAPGEYILEQGKPNAYLYLVDEGTLKMTCHIDGKEIPVKQLEKGHFVGDDTFLSIQAFCSVSVKTETNTKVRRLPKQELKNWNKKFPGMNNKIEEYLIKSGATHELLSSMRLNRRSQERIRISGKGKFQLFDASGRKMGNPFKGTLLDVSAGGMCFAIRLSKREAARMLVGRNIHAQFDIRLDKGEMKIDQSGTIIGVHEYDLADYSIHIKFNEIIEQLKKLRK